MSDMIKSEGTDFAGQPSEEAITGAQVRMARAAVKWTVSDLAERANIPWARLQQVERANGVPSAKEEIMHALRSVLEGEGVVFLSGGTGRGVLLRDARG